ncbi:MAG TPA: hypothetical protein VJX67_03745 [Blastocatellia bacterium]|nr:hypothetical protein [Blastocatellia bacterium]
MELVNHHGFFDLAAKTSGNPKLPVVDRLKSRLRDASARMLSDGWIFIYDPL